MKIYQILDFASLGDNWVKIKENEKRDTYQDLTSKLKRIMEHQNDWYQYTN